MNIIGFEKNSLVDYNGNIASVIFTPGCNMNCWYCHNREIINKSEGNYSEEDIFDFLKKRIGFIDGVVISGGEPTLQEDLKDFIIKIKNMGFLVKLDTNGTNPSVVKDLIECKLLDYIAMDIKAPFEKYGIVTVCKNIEDVKKSVEIIKNSNIDYEFRTTFAPNLKVDDIKNLLLQISNGLAITRYSLQAYRKPDFIEKLMEMHTQDEFNLIKEFSDTNGLVKQFIIKNL